MSYLDARGDFHIESTVFLENLVLKYPISCFFFSDTVELKLSEGEFPFKGVVPDDGIK